MAFISVNDRTEFRLIIEATVAEGQHGDIAIDDVTFTPGCRFVMSMLLITRLKAADMSG